MSDKSEKPLVSKNGIKIDLVLSVIFFYLMREILVPHVPSQDPTAVLIKYTFPNCRPAEGVRAMTYMAEPINFKTPDYMFYENNRGFHFRCLESLYRESADTTRNRSFVAFVDLLSAFNPNFGTPDNESESPITKPYSFTFAESYNTLANTRRGMFGSTIFSHNLIDKKFTISPHKSTSTLKNFT